MSGHKSIEGEYHEEEYIDITVTEPQTLRDGEKEYTTYKITTETTFPEYNQRFFSVRRRYSQFVTLHGILKKKLNGNPKNIKFGALPSLPGDTMSSLFSSKGRFEPEFIEKRRAALEEWLNAVAHHSFLRFESALHSFLQDEEWPKK